MGRLTSKLDRWENHVCRPITPDPKHCSACPDKQRQLDSQQSRFRQLESDHASELRKLERQVQDLQAQLQSFSGLQQVHAILVHLRRMSFRHSLTCSIEASKSLQCLECTVVEAPAAVTPNAGLAHALKRRWLQILESVEHARQDISSYNDQVTKMAHAKQDIEDVSYKLKALMRFSR